jgi:hypothetical protein
MTTGTPGNYILTGAWQLTVTAQLTVIGLWVSGNAGGGSGPFAAFTAITVMGLAVTMFRIGANE